MSAEVAPDQTTSAPAGLSLVPGQRRWRSRRVSAPWPYLAAALVLLALISVYPLIVLVHLAFSDVGPSNLIGSWPWVGLANFRAALADPQLVQSAKVTGELSAMLLVSDLVVGFVVASVLVARSRSTTTVLSVMVFVWALPPLVSGTVWKFMLSGSGVVNSLLGLIGVRPVDFLASPSLAVWSVGLVTSWAALPFATLVLRAGILAVPRELIEAAAIDGASYWRIQSRVVLPLLRPTITVLAILAIIYSFQGFNFIYAMTSGGPGTATANIPYLAYQHAFTSFELSSGGAIALLAVAFVLVLAVPYAIGVGREGRVDGSRPGVGRQANRARP